MSRRDQKSHDKFYVLDLNNRAKARIVAEAAAAGGAAAIFTKVAFGLFLPEAWAVFLCVPAFTNAADYTATRFNDRLRPQDLTVREKRRPRIDLG